MGPNGTCRTSVPLARLPATARGDVRHADERCAFFHDEAGGVQVAIEAGGGAEVTALGDGGVALDGAGDCHLVGGDVAFHAGVFAQVENAAGDVAALDGAIETEFAFEGE